MKMLFFLSALGILFGCDAGPFAPTGNTSALSSSFSVIYRATLGPKCLQCHSSTVAQGGVSLQDFSSAITSPGTVVPYQPYQSQLYKQILNVQFFPRPHLELNAFYQHQQVGGSGTPFGDFFYILFHFYL